MNVLITDVTDGVGAALALEYAAKGNTLLLVGPEHESLTRISEACKSRGARVLSKICDVKNYVTLGAWMENCDGDYPLDSVLITSGASISSSDLELNHHGKVESWEQVKGVFEVNINRVLYILLCASRLMQKRGEGRVMLLNSFASKIPIHGFASYAASKAAVKFYADSVRNDMDSIGISLTLVYLGQVVDSASGKSIFALSTFMKPDMVARKVKRAMDSNSPEVYIGFGLKFITAICCFLPVTFISTLFKRKKVL